jgi:transcriptional regulator with PAS, ATPase and Fis domain
VQRVGDIEALAWHFIAELGQAYGRTLTGIERRAREALLDYAWPGNVRELKNVIEHAYVVGEGSVLRFSHLTPELRGEPPPTDPASESRGELEHRQRRKLVETLESTGWRKGEAAAELGISRSTLWRRMRELGLSGGPS